MSCCHSADTPSCCLLGISLKNYHTSMALRALPLFQLNLPSSSAKCSATCSNEQGLEGSRPPVTARMAV